MVIVIWQCDGCEKQKESKRVNLNTMEIEAPKNWWFGSGRKSYKIYCPKCFKRLINDKP